MTGLHQNRNRDKGVKMDVKQESNDIDDKKRGMGGPRGGDRGGRRGGYRGGHGGGERRGPPQHMNPGHGMQGPPQKIKPPPKTQEEVAEEMEETEHTPAEVKKFTGRCRLFVGNLPNDTKEDDFRKLFEPYGEMSEIYLNQQRGFGFVRLDTRQNAEIAKAALDGTQKKGRVLRVRFATHGAALRVKHLDPYVSNELLESAFSVFGTIERAIAIVDDRGKPTGEGIVEFARKPGAMQSLNRCSEGVFLLGASPRPIIVEPLEQKDEDDGLPDKFIARTPQYVKEREMAPRFANMGSFEFEFGQKWKELYRVEEDQKQALQRQIEEQHAKLEMEMGQAQIEHQAVLLRQDYLRKQEELKRMEEMHQAEIQRRLDMRRQEDEMRRQEVENRRQETMVRQQQEEELRRRKMERSGMYGTPRDLRGERDMRGGDRNAPPMQPPPAPPAGLGIENRRHGSMNPQGMGGPNGLGPQMGGPQPMRQSRFDQPPAVMGGSGFANNMGGGAMMGGGPRGGGDRPDIDQRERQEQERAMAARERMEQDIGRHEGNGTHMGGEAGGRMGGGAEGRMMERRERAGQREGGDEYFENKRARRY